MMELVARGELPSTELVTHRSRFEDIVQVYIDLDSGTLDSVQVVLTV